MNITTNKMMKNDWKNLQHKTWKDMQSHKLVVIRAFYVFIGILEHENTQKKIWSNDKKILALKHNGISNLFDPRFYHIHRFKLKKEQKKTKQTNKTNQAKPN